MPDSIPPTPWVNQWSEVRPVTLIGKRRAYFEIPVFEVGDLPIAGPAIIAAVFNYAAVRNLTLRNLPAKPEDVNYVPCIKYRNEDGEVFRYKLWEVDEDTIYYPVYNGELILSNFQIEIWNLPGGETVSNDAVITINNSIVVNRSDNFIPTQSDTVEEPEDETIVTDLDNTNATANPSIVSDVTADWDADLGVTDAGGGAVSAWVSQSPGAFNLTQGTGANRPTLVTASAEINNHNYILFDGVNDVLSGTGLVDCFIVHSFFVIYQVAWTDTEDILTTDDGLNLQQAGTTPNIKGFDTDVSAEADNNVAEVGTWYIVEIFATDGVGSPLALRIVNLSTGATTEVVSENDSTSGLLITQLDLGFANVRIARFVSYGTVLDNDDREQMISYLKYIYSNNYSNRFGLPLTYTNSQHGVANS